ncbi:hypothetical protein EV356DRAFT_537672 [Viridothelium virens]|uniref:Uncharacterized protein n=1 Tax=Viridothelium virens TaxID=1048519 RepID=A0A6A6GT22_VIRVR|nr:hypothetical protein EV356DRAFT_537672 [Viridothelium virens]
MAEQGRAGTPASTRAPRTHCTPWHAFGTQDRPRAANGAQQERATAPSRLLNPPNLPPRGLPTCPSLSLLTMLTFSSSSLLLSAWPPTNTARTAVWATRRPSVHPRRAPGPWKPGFTFADDDGGRVLAATLTLISAAIILLVEATTS